jgi:hypothetical protein
MPPLSSLFLFSLPQIFMRCATYRQFPGSAYDAAVKLYHSADNDEDCDLHHFAPSGGHWDLETRTTVLPTGDVPNDVTPESSLWCACCRDRLQDASPTSCLWTVHYVPFEADELGTLP